jgi:hypothetical protein
VIASGFAQQEGGERIGNSVITPSVVMRPMALLSVNHNAPSGPAVMPTGLIQQPPKGVYSVIVPEVVIRPILPGPTWLAPSANHRAPSGPNVIPPGMLTSEVTLCSVMLFHPTDEPGVVAGVSAAIAWKRDAVSSRCADRSVGRLKTDNAIERAWGFITASFRQKGRVHAEAVPHKRPPPTYIEATIQIESTDCNGDSPARKSQTLTAGTLSPRPSRCQSPESARARQRALKHRRHTAQRPPSATCLR